MEWQAQHIYELPSILHAQLSKKYVVVQFHQYLQLFIIMCHI